MLILAHREVQRHGRCRPRRIARRRTSATAFARRAHTKSSKCGDSRRNTQRPAKNSATATASATSVAPFEREPAVEQRVAQPPDEPAERIGGDPRPHRFRARASTDRGSASGTSGSSAPASARARRRARTPAAPRRTARCRSPPSASTAHSGMRDQQAREMHRLAVDTQHGEHGEVAGELQRERRGNRRVDDELVRERDLADQARRSRPRLVAPRWMPPARRATATAPRRRTRGSSSPPKPVRAEDRREDEVIDGEQRERTRTPTRAR